MKKIVFMALVLVLAASVCYAVEKTPKATEPVGAVIETGGVFVGTIVGAIEKATTGEKKITVQADTGETRVFPFAETTQLVDDAFHAVTFNQLKGRKAKVEYTAKGAKSVTVTK